MDRRQFMGITLGGIASSAFASSTLASCAGQHGVSVAAASRRPMDAVAFHKERRFANTTFGRIAYVERGSGKVALFLHGYPLNGFQWRGALERLSPYRRCIAADFLGMGYCEVPAEQSLAPDAQVAMLAALLDELSVHEVDLIANDSGGSVAQLFMTTHPDRVRTLLLTNCDVENDSPPPSFLPIIAAAKAGVFADKSLALALADKALARSARGIGGLAYTYPAHPTDEALDTYFTPLLSSPLRKRQVEAYAIALERNYLAGITPKLQASRIPVRIVWGTGDSVFKQASADWLDRTVGNSHGVRRVPGAKLFWPEEFPEVIAEEARGLWGV